ncbi:DNA-binding protein [Staphylococcus aureus]|nr:DNA-binding protein [Staphylococcus aureus]MBU8153413.1 DNA-binding protein [Staphylococcus aureus]MBU8158774.1 DNA-binding protein [Staphylococcus aureus]
MKLQKSNHTILLVLEKGEDIVECITTFADDQDLTFTSVSGIGACDDVVLKFFNLTTKQYEEKHITEPLELTSLLGNISRLDNGHFAHLHATFGTQSYETFSGHLASATAEIILTVTDLDIQRSFKDAVGLNLLDPQ